MISPRLDASLLCGTEGSNLASSTSESVANLTSSPWRSLLSLWASAHYRWVNSQQRVCAHREWFPSQRCFVAMDRVSHYRELADHARHLAEATWQDDLEEMLRRLARDFDETAEDVEAGATEVRHPEVLR